MTSGKTMAIGLGYKITASGLKPNRTLAYIPKRGAFLSNNQTRHRLTGKNLKHNYDGQIVGLLSQNFPLFLHPQLVYIGTVRHKGRDRDLYVPPRDKPHLVSGSRSTR